MEASAGTIRSPAKGRVLQIVARPGEAVGPAGVVTIADTSSIDVIAQIYETDIARVHPGAKSDDPLRCVRRLHSRSGRMDQPANFEFIRARGSRAARPAGVPGAHRVDRPERSLIAFIRR